MGKNQDEEGERDNILVDFLSESIRGRFGK